MCGADLSDLDEEIREKENNIRKKSGQDKEQDKRKEKKP
jgi:hypothetical protein